MNIEQIIEKYGIENPSALAAAGCSSEEYNQCVSRNRERVSKMTDEEYKIYIEPRNQQIEEDAANFEEHQARKKVSGKELLKNWDERKINESPRG